MDYFLGILSGVIVGAILMWLKSMSGSPKEIAVLSERIDTLIKQRDELVTSVKEIEQTAFKLYNKVTRLEAHKEHVDKELERLG